LSAGAATANGADSLRIPAAFCGVTEAVVAVVSEARANGDGQAIMLHQAVERFPQKN